MGNTARPRRLPLVRDGIHFVIEDESGDFSWTEMDALQLQIDRWNTHHPKAPPVEKISPEMLDAVLRVKWVFPGAVIESWA